MFIIRHSGLDILDLGRVSFKQAFLFQLKIHNQVVSADKPDTLILCEHPPTITLSRNSNVDNIINYELIKKRNFDFVIGLNRGGEVTYHGPGQLVGYLIFDLRKIHRDLSIFFDKIESALIGTLQALEINASKKAKFRGVWVKDKKIASIGIGIDRFVSMHGFALNVNVELEHFSLIRPCGLDIEMTSIEKERGHRIPLLMLKRIIAESFMKEFVLSLSKKDRRENVCYV